MILLTLTLCCLLVTASPLANSILPLRPSISSIDHINLNIPSHSPFLEFYHALGLHPDPHRFRNLALNNKVVNKATNEVIFKGGKGTVWMNAGSSQIHLPAGKTAQVRLYSFRTHTHYLIAVKKSLAIQFEPLLNMRRDDLVLRCLHVSLSDMNPTSSTYQFHFTVPKTQKLTHTTHQFRKSTARSASTTHPRKRFCA